jgi:hypothetical protein
VQVSVLSGVAEIDAISAVPEPSAAVLLLSGIAGMIMLKKRTV